MDADWTKTNDPMQALCERQIYILLANNHRMTAPKIRNLLTMLEQDGNAIKVEHVNAALVDMIHDLRISVDKTGRFYL